MTVERTARMLEIRAQASRTPGGSITLRVQLQLTRQQALDVLAAMPVLPVLRHVIRALALALSDQSGADG